MTGPSPLRGEVGGRLNAPSTFLVPWGTRAPQAEASTYWRQADPRQFAVCSKMENSLISHKCAKLAVYGIPAGAVGEVVGALRVLESVQNHVFPCSYVLGYGAWKRPLLRWRKG